LLVEDDGLIGSLLAEILIDLGYDVCETVTTEGGAVAAASRHQPDLMVVDLQLVHGNGISAMQTILRTTAMRHIYMTGVASPTLPETEIVLRKPFGAGELARALQLAFASPPTP